MHLIYQLVDMTYRVMSSTFTEASSPENRMTSVEAAPWAAVHGFSFLKVTHPEVAKLKSTKGGNNSLS